MIMSSLAVFFAIIWLSQAVAGILYREAGDPARLLVWIPLGLTTYALWHVLKTTTRAPVEPFEWTETERELLLAAPFERRDLIRYRLLSITSAAALKALCFGLVMIPDLPCWPLGFLGMLLALTFLDLLRMLVEVVVWGVRPATRLKLRAAVLTVAVGATLSGLVSTLAHPAAAERSVPLGLITRFMTAMMELRITLPGQIAMAPFRVFAGVILADELTWSLLGQIGLAISIVLFTAVLLIRSDAFFQRRLAARERKRFTLIPSRRLPDGAAVAETPTVRPCGCPRHGVGSLRSPGGNASAWPTTRVPSLCPCCCQASCRSWWSLPMPRASRW